MDKYFGKMDEAGRKFGEAMMDGVEVNEKTASEKRSVGTFVEDLTGDGAGKYPFEKDAGQVDLLPGNIKISVNPGEGNHPEDEVMVSQAGAKANFKIIDGTKRNGSLPNKKDEERASNWVKRYKKPLAKLYETKDYKKFKEVLDYDSAYRSHPKAFKKFDGEYNGPMPQFTDQNLQSHFAGTERSPLNKLW